ncbi:CD36 family [Cinara cedri]|uniref:CD36 family n=1 Tax=Cinara cedri TaxID=506608 RepID=A0A5E4N9T9_9HEMI|nr:CD36 family [Cinara cedri]
MRQDSEEIQRLIPSDDDDDGLQKSSSHFDGFWCHLLLSLFGVVLLFTGIVMAELWPWIYKNMMRNELELKNDSRTYTYWQRLPEPLTMSVYLFNWTNAEETLRNGQKPILQQLGPYVFKEYHTKVNTTFNHNNTITYKQFKSWKYDRIISNGSLSDEVTTINVVLNILGEKLLAIDKTWLSVIAGYYLKLSNIKPYVTKTAGDFIFEGYDDPLLNVAIQLKRFFPLDLPFKKVGWFYGMNMSTSADGLINMFTGKGDIDRLGLLHSVNYKSNLNNFNEDCSHSNAASAGDLWPEHTASEPNASIYVPTLCSAITMTKRKHTDVNGIRGIEFSAGSDVFNNTCYCPSSECPLPGLRSLNLCKDNPSPMFISFPHFYLADKSYNKSIVGMNPDRALHEFKMILENDYSIPLYVAARLQFNIRVRPIKNFKILEDVPKVFLPVFWFSETFQIPHDLSNQLLIVTNVLPTYVTYLWFIMSLIGFLVIIISTYLCVKNTNKSFSVLSSK